MPRRRGMVLVNALARMPKGPTRSESDRRRPAAVTSLLAVMIFGAACSQLTQGTSLTPTTAAYVALGDSYTAGPLIPDQVGSPALCLRSDHSYPYLVDQAISAPTFLDVSCQGATTADMTASQKISAVGVALQSNPPQFNALSASTKLVTLGIGGNDIGFSSIAITCAKKSVSDPTGSPCKDYYTAGGTDQLATTIDNTETKIASTLQSIHKLAPNAKIFLVGYPDLLPTTGPGCYPTVPIASGDIPYLNSVNQELNAMLQTAAQSNGATFVDTFDSSIGHDACAPNGANWVTGVVPNQPAAPLHPDSAGMANTAKQVEAAIVASGFSFGK